MNTILKRVVSLLLCLVMTAGYMPTNAFATETGETVTTETTAVTTEATGEPSEETEAPSESTEALAEQSVETESSEEEEKESVKESKKAEKESKKEEKEAEKEAKKEEKESKKEAEPSTEPSTEATEPSTEASEPSTEAIEPSTEATEPSTEATEPTTETNPDDLLMTLEIEDEADPVAAALEVRSGVTVSSDALAEAQAYIDALTINNTSNDPATVVGNFGTHFTWDNEKRENSKSYLFDWSYYNGVVFEGLEYLYEITGKTVYKDYVVEYMSSLITSEGTWASCTNNTSKQAAGYDATHGADCYKTASLLLDLYEMTNDSRYLTMAATLYADLDTAAGKYSLSNAGKNYRHTWSSDPSPDLWLDGLYMILPFRAEYAKKIGDTEELDLIVDRMQWVSDNMYNETKGLFYHAADSATSNSGTYWLRSIGWYAAAIVDIMDSMSGDNLEAMKVQLKKLVDGMLLVQNSTNGMWLNNMAASQSSTNPYETSGTALVCYAVMKAVNEGWLDKAYADMAVLAFNGICSEKLSGTTLTDICFKGAPGSSNSTFYNNEGKGVGPFIMLYAEVLEYTGVKPEQPEEPEETEPSEPTEPEDQEITVEGAEGETSVTMTVSGVSAPVVAAALTEEDKTLLDAHEGIESYVAIDVTGTLAEGEQATFTVAVPDGWDADRMVGISVEEGEVKEIPGTHENGYFTFTVDHFSAKGYALTAEAAEGDDTAAVSSSGNLVGGKVYTLNTDGVIDTSKTYLIVNTNSGTGYALTNNGSNTPGSTSFEISDGKITVEDDSKIAWVFSGTSSGTVKNGTRYLYLSSNSILSTSSRTIYFSNQNNGAYRLYKTDSTRYLIYSNGNWSRSSSASNVYLYEYTSSSAGEAVTFTVTPASATIAPNGTVALTGAVIVAGKTVDLDDCTITWASKDEDVATVSNGTVTGVADGTANITATLSAVNGTALQDDIVLTIPVTVASKTVESITLNPASGTVYVNSGDAALTGGKVKITYEGGDEQNINITVGMLSGDFNTAKTGTYSGLKVIYNGEEVEGTFTLNVVEAPDMNYPEYPDPGSVDLDKYIADYSQFQNTGVAEVNLTTSGLPAMTGVDVILVTDLSNSMAWTAGSRTDATSHEATKMYDLQQAVASFADTFLDEEGVATANTISLVTFGGYDADYTNKVYEAYADPTQTLLLRATNRTTVKNTINNIRVLAESVVGSDSSTGYYLSFDGGATYGENYGNTNYDHAFMQTASAIADLKAAYAAENGIAYDESGRSIYILFMTDGAPSNYNGVYYQTKTGDRADVNSTWSNSAGEVVTYTMGSYNNGSWYSYIAGSAYNSTTDSITGNPLYWADQVYNTPGVADLFSIGFDIDNGGFSNWYFTKDAGYPLIKVLEKLVTGKTLTVESADDAAGLQAIYAKLASQIKLAATNAYYIDQMGDNFKIQMASTVTKFVENSEETEVITLTPKPQITISTQPIYTPGDVNGTTVTTDMIGEPYGNKTILETVTFNDAGTEAYSDIDVDGDGDTDENIIDANGVIVAKNFWYNTTTSAVMIDTDGDGTTDYSLPAETFYWNIGTINNQEFIMSYYVYLEGSAEGEKAAGTYATNNKATLYYENWLGNDAWQDVDSPALSWESAAVYYGFYLVDKDGNPVMNRATGETGTFEQAVKVTTKIFYDEVYLNEIESFATISVASTEVPDGYTIYDEGATYTIKVNSDLAASGWTIENSVAPDTTYVTDYYGSSYTNVIDSDTIADHTNWDYTSTTVWFAVVWEPSTVPDVVVIDYGLPVDINVLENDMFGTNGSLIGVGAWDDKPDEVEKVSDFTYSDSALFTSEFNSTYGTVTLNGREARYKPTTMEMPTYDKFSYEVLYNNETTEAMEYYYGDVTVIPATTIYYEDSFLKLDKGNSAGWSSVAEESDATQAEDRPGYFSLSYMDANNIYGYDGAYANCSTYSLENAAKVHLENGQYATAEFTFYGTGFDVISLTSDETGVLAVQVSEGNTFDAENLERDTLVNTYYGMNADGTVYPNNPAALYQVPVMKIENLPYGQYTARITATYVGFFDKTDPAGYDLYLDAIRIYDPAGTQYGESDDADGVTGNLIDGVIQDAYIDDNEGWPVYVELRNHIISAAEVKVTTGDDGNPKVTSVDADKEKIGAMFIDCANDNTSISDYVSYGPNNELYLAANQAVAFSLGMDEAAWDNVADVQIGLKVANGDSVNYKVYDSATDEEADVTAETLNTATDMYYSIKSHAAGTTVIKNVSGGILSITNIKITYKTDPNGTAVTMEMTEEDAGMVLMSLRAPRVIEPEVPETGEPEESIPETSVPEESLPEESVPETTDPEETVPETTVPEETEDQREQVEEAVKEVVKTVVKTVKNVLQNLFSKWFR